MMAIGGGIGRFSRGKPAQSQPSQDDSSANNEDKTQPSVENDTLPTTAFHDMEDMGPNGVSTDDSMWGPFDQAADGMNSDPMFCGIEDNFDIASIGDKSFEIPRQQGDNPVSGVTQGNTSSAGLGLFKKSRDQSIAGSSVPNGVEQKKTAEPKLDNDFIGESVKEPEASTEPGNLPTASSCMPTLADAPNQSVVQERVASPTSMTSLNPQSRNPQHLTGKRPNRNFIQNGDRHSLAPMASYLNDTHDSSVRVIPRPIRPTPPFHQETENMATGSLSLPAFSTRARQGETTLPPVPKRVQITTPQGNPTRTEEFYLLREHGSNFNRKNSAESSSDANAPRGSGISSMVMRTPDSTAYSTEHPPCANQVRHVPAVTPGPQELKNPASIFSEKQTGSGGPSSEKEVRAFPTQNNPHTCHPRTETTGNHVSFQSKAGEDVFLAKQTPHQSSDSHQDEGVTPFTIQEDSKDIDFNDMHAKFLIDLRDLEDVQNINAARLLDMETLLTTGHSSCLQDYAKFLDLVNQAEKVVQMADGFIKRTPAV